MKIKITYEIDLDEMKKWLIKDYNYDEEYYQEHPKSSLENFIENYFEDNLGLPLEITDKSYNELFTKLFDYLISDLMIIQLSLFD